MSYHTWSVIYGEQPSASKWNQLGENDAGFKDGTNIDDEAIISRHLAADAMLVGLGTKTSSQGTFTSETDITGLTVTFTADGVHSYRLSAILDITSSVNSDAAAIWIKEGSTYLRRAGGTLAFNNVSYTLSTWVIVTPTAGSHTYKVTALRTGGTGNLTVDAGTGNPSPAYLLAQQL